VSHVCPLTVQSMQGCSDLWKCDAAGHNRWLPVRCPHAPNQDRDRRLWHCTDCLRDRLHGHRCLLIPLHHPPHMDGHGFMPYSSNNYRHADDYWPEQCANNCDSSCASGSDVPFADQQRGNGILDGWVRHERHHHQLHGWPANQRWLCDALSLNEDMDQSA
jgi:hypothetical protein